MIRGLRILLLLAAIAAPAQVADSVCRSSGSLAGFYVAPGGSDSNNAGNAPGAASFAAPFASWTRALTAMRATPTKTTYMRGGSYAPAVISACEGGADTCLLDLEAASGDNGVTFSYYPPDGYNTASITGGSTGVGNGAVNCINIHASNVTINGLHLHNCQYSMVRVTGGSNNALTIINSELDHQYIPLTTRVSGGAISCYGCANAVTSHNHIHDIGAMGITFAEANGVITNWVAESNYLERTCTNSADCGSIYLFDPPATSSGTIWRNNYIRDGNTFASVGSSFGAGLYADDCAGDILMTGNVLAGRNGSNTVMFHGGKNLRFNNNLVDITTLQQHLVTFQGLPSCTDTTMSGDQVKNNIFIGTGPGTGYPLLSGSPTSPPTITNNDYFAYAPSGSINHVVMLLEENQNYASVVGVGGLTYFNGLITNGGLATQYYGNVHPSIGNYFWLTAGQVINTNNAYDPGSGGDTSDNIVRHLLASGRTWKEYCENRPSVGYTGGDVYPFIQHHCPLGYFSDVRGSGTQLNNLVGFPQFTTDLTSGPDAENLPNYSFIEPNQLNNAHDGSLATADSWLNTNIGPLSSDAGRMANTLLLVLFDESANDNTHGGGRVYWTASGPSVKTGFSSSFSFYQHDSTARESLEALGMAINMSGAATAPSMAEFFKAPVALATTGSGGTDAAPSTLDPQLTDWQYTISGASPVLSAPVSFADLCRTWGPPGFTVPHTGLVPSSPHVN